MATPFPRGRCGGFFTVLLHLRYGYKTMKGMKISGFHLLEILEFPVLQQGAMRLALRDTNATFVLTHAKPQPLAHARPQAPCPRKAIGLGPKGSGFAGRACRQSQNRAVRGSGSRSSVEINGVSNGNSIIILFHNKPSLISGFSHLRRQRADCRSACAQNRRSLPGFPACRIRTRAS